MSLLGVHSTLCSLNTAAVLVCSFVFFAVLQKTSNRTRKETEMKRRWSRGGLLEELRSEKWL